MTRLEDCSTVILGLLKKISKFIFSIEKILRSLLPSKKSILEGRCSLRFDG
jgi:hypothetical protein